jgi:LPXTG-motif cell wall-anchored protein
MAQKARAARLVTLALATGTLVAMTSTAGAATTTNTATDLVAKAQGASVQITINIPSALKSVFGTDQLVQKISFTDGNVLTSNLADVAATANLGRGNIPAVSSLLDKTAKATLASPTADASVLALHNPQGLPVDLGVGTLSSLVSSPVATTKGTLSKSKSELVGLTVGNVVAIPSLANNVISPVTSAINDQLQSTSGTVAGTVNTVTNTLVDIANTADGQLSASGVKVTPTVKAAADTLATTLQSTLDQLGGLTDLINGLAAKNANAVELHTLLSSHEITRNGNAVSSHVENSIASIDVLSGLVTVDGLESAATATAGGTAGSASTSVTKPVLHVKVADALDFVLDQAGIHLTGTLGDVAAPLQPVVNGALTTVTGLVNDVAGISVDYGKVTQSADPQGRFAVADVPGVTLTIDPPILHGKLAGQTLPVKVLDDGKKFIQIALVPAHAEVLAVHANKPATPIKEYSPENPTGPLPHTGGEYGVLFAVGAMLLTGAAIVRRRRFSEV